MDDEKARKFLDWVLGEKAPVCVKEGLQGFGEFEEVEKAAREVLGPRCDEALIGCRVIRYFEERRKMDPDPTRSNAARFVPIRKFLDAFFNKHPEFHDYRPLLDYYLTKTELWDETIYVPPEHKPKHRPGSLTGWFMSIKDNLTGKARV